MVTWSWSIVALAVLFVVFAVIFGVAFAIVSTYVQKKRKAKK